jgi:hypothetical protein
MVERYTTVELRENIGMRNPYALADYFDEVNGRPKKEWKKILLGLDPNFNLETALRDSLGKPGKALKVFPWFPRELPDNLFEPGPGNPLYYEYEREVI